MSKRPYIFTTINDCGQNVDRIHAHWTARGLTAYIVRYWWGPGTGHTFVAILDRKGKWTAEDDDRERFDIPTPKAVAPKPLAQSFEAALGNMHNVTSAKWGTRE